MKFLKKFATRAEYEAYMADNMENYPHVGYIADEGAVEYVKEAPPRPERMPLHFEAIEDMTVSFSTNAIEYSLDNEIWQTLPAATATPTISAGSKVFFRASGLAAASSAGIGTFSTTGKFNAVGNVMSMISGADFVNSGNVGKYGLASLFSLCNGLVNADKLILPAMSLGQYCYNYMFNKCTSLVTAPELPATTLGQYCYSYMFSNCTSLVTAPELPATTLAKFCYNGMFNKCTSLVNAPELPATTLVESCYYYMFQDCTSLVTAPELPATTLEFNVYHSMFKNCNNLQYIKAMFTTTPGSNYMSNWVSGVGTVGTFVKNAAATWTDAFNVSAIPWGWTVETATE